VKKSKPELDADAAALAAQAPLTLKAEAVYREAKDTAKRLWDERAGLWAQAETIERAYALGLETRYVSVDLHWVPAAHTPAVTT
jgi:hypothetical protein